MSALNPQCSPSRGGNCCSTRQNECPNQARRVRAGTAPGHTRSHHRQWPRTSGRFLRRPAPELFVRRTLGASLPSVDRACRRTRRREELRKNRRMHEPLFESVALEVSRVFLRHTQFLFRRYVVPEDVPESPFDEDLKNRKDDNWGDGGQPEQRFEFVLNADGCKTK